MLIAASSRPTACRGLRYNIAPTDQIPIVRIDLRDGEREVVMARWGLIPFLDETEAKGAAHQCACRNRRKAAALSRGSRQATLPDPSNRLLRVAEREDGWGQPFGLNEDPIPPPRRPTSPKIDIAEYPRTEAARGA